MYILVYYIAELDALLGDTQCEITGQYYCQTSLNFLIMNGRNDEYPSVWYNIRNCRYIILPDQETAIMHRLQNAILESFRTLTEVQDLCAELDW